MAAPTRIRRVGSHIVPFITRNAVRSNYLQQQARFDDFIEEFNQERPHEALAMQCPAELYEPSARPYRGLDPIDYPIHDRTLTVTR